VSLKTELDDGHPVLGQFPGREHLVAQPGASGQRQDVLLVAGGAEGQQDAAAGT